MSGAATPSIAVCLTSHNRIDCARINQEVFKLNFATPFTVVHACSGAQRAPYLEDAFEWCEPRPLHEGAIHLLQRSIALAVDGFAPDFLVHLEADTWVLDERVILDYVGRLAAGPALVATSAWSDVHTSVIGRGLRGLRQVAGGGVGRMLSAPRAAAYDAHDFSTQFFIIKNDPALIDCLLTMERTNDRNAEIQFFDAFSARFELDRVVRMREREPVHPHNRYVCERLALYCQHWPAAGTANDPRPPTDPLYVAPSFIGKKEALQRHPNLRNGESIARLLAANDYDYYNPGALRY